MKTKILLAAIFAIVVLSLPSIAQTAVVTPAELKLLEGTEWVGTLTYLDYRSNKPISIKSNITLTAATDRSWKAEYKYPDEPKANSVGNIALSPDGTVFNEQKVIERIRSKDGVIKIVTTKEGTDNDKKALFRYTYTISPTKFSLRKEVRAEGSTEFFERNLYSWSR